jgi:ABC-2 type transport system permease protein
LQDALDYVWITQALLMPLYLWGWWEIGNTIRSGDVVADLTKPFDYYAFWLSQDAGRAIYHVLFRGAPTILVGVLLFGVRLPLDGGRWSLFLLSLALAVWISFGLRFIMNVAAFWLLDYRGVGALVMFAGTLLSGFLVPLVYWPDWARGAVTWLPFAGMVQIPVDMLLGKHSGIDSAGALGFQLAWGVALALACRVILTLAERKVVIQGG